MIENKRRKSGIRFLRMSLATFLLLVTLFCIWIASASQHAADQKKSLSLLSDAGGTANFKHEALKWPKPHSSFPSDKTFDAKIRTPGPAWLHDAVGHDFFRSVVSVKLSEGTPASEELIASLARLPQLRWADFSYSDITDSMLSTIGNMSQLQVLMLDRNRITDDGLRSVTNLSSLEVLDVSMCRRINGLFLRDAMNMRALKELDVQLTPFDGINLQFIRFHPQIQQIGLRETNIKDEHLEYLTTMPRLKILDLGKTQITCNGIAKLAANSQLIHLYLEGQNVSNDWIPHLSKMKSLEYLALWNTNIDDDSVDRLKVALPKCDISHR